jgi:hypothetical protein
MKVLTVMDMYTRMGDLIAQGKGSLLVLIPNWEDEDNDGDYRCIGEVEDVDVTGTCVYLCGVNAEEENKFWEEWKK